jgi:hypothetical protein
MSIDAKDLRIGNWVETYMVMIAGSWYDQEGKKHGQDIITEPTINRRQITADDLKIIIEAAGLATYRPIPLSPELLLWCGFEKADAGNFRFGRFFLGNYSKGKYGFAWRKDIMDSQIGNPSTEISCLHELQNLYFALTNKELEINL